MIPVFLIFQFLMETHKLHIYEKKRYKAPDHYFARCCNYMPKEPEEWDELSIQSDKPWEDEAFQKVPNWLELRIEALVDKCFQHFGKT